VRRVGVLLNLAANHPEAQGRITAFVRGLQELGWSDRRNVLVDTWTPDGESIVEHIAGVEDYQVALATYRAACQRCLAHPLPCGRVRE
jgi:hypothetical protein